MVRKTVTAKKAAPTYLLPGGSNTYYASISRVLEKTAIPHVVLALEGEKVGTTWLELPIWNKNTGYGVGQVLLLEEGNITALSPLGSVSDHLAPQLLPLFGEGSLGGFAICGETAESHLLKGVGQAAYPAPLPDASESGVFMGPKGARVVTLTETCVAQWIQVSGEWGYWYPGDSTRAIPFDTWVEATTVIHHCPVVYAGDDLHGQLYSKAKAENRGSKRGPRADAEIDRDNEDDAEVVFSRKDQRKARVGYGDTGHSDLSHLGEELVTSPPEGIHLMEPDEFLFEYCPGAGTPITDVKQATHYDSETGDCHGPRIFSQARAVAVEVNGYLQITQCEAHSISFVPRRSYQEPVLMEELNGAVTRLLGYQGELQTTHAKIAISKKKAMHTGIQIVIPDTSADKTYVNRVNSFLREYAGAFEVGWNSRLRCGTPPGGLPYLPGRIEEDIPSGLIYSPSIDREFSVEWDGEGIRVVAPDSFRQGCGFAALVANFLQKEGKIRGQEEAAAARMFRAVPIEKWSGYIVRSRESTQLDNIFMTTRRIADSYPLYPNQQELLLAVKRGGLGPLGLMPSAPLSLSGTPEVPKLPPNFQMPPSITSHRAEGDPKKGSNICRSFFLLTQVGAPVDSVGVQLKRTKDEISRRVDVNFWSRLTVKELSRIGLNLSIDGISELLALQQIQELAVLAPIIAGDPGNIAFCRTGSSLVALWIGLIGLPPGEVGAAADLIAKGMFNGAKDPQGCLSAVALLSVALMGTFPLAAVGLRVLVALSTEADLKNIMNLKPGRNVRLVELHTAIGRWENYGYWVIPPLSDQSFPAPGSRETEFEEFVLGYNGPTVPYKTLFHQMVRAVHPDKNQNSDLATESTKALFAWETTGEKVFSTRSTQPKPSTRTLYLGYVTLHRSAKKAYVPKLPEGGDTEVYVVDMRVDFENSFNDPHRGGPPVEASTFRNSLEERPSLWFYVASALNTAAAIAENHDDKGVDPVLIMGCNYGKHRSRAGAIGVACVLSGTISIDDIPCLSARKSAVQLLTRGFKAELLSHVNSDSPSAAGEAYAAISEWVSTRGKEPFVMSLGESLERAEGEDRNVWDLLGTVVEPESSHEETQENTPNESEDQTQLKKDQPAVVSELAKKEPRGVNSSGLLSNSSSQDQPAVVSGSAQKEPQENSSGLLSNSGSLVENSQEGQDQQVSKTATLDLDLSAMPTPNYLEEFGTSPTEKERRVRDAWGKLEEDEDWEDHYERAVHRPTGTDDEVHDQSNLLRQNVPKTEELGDQSDDYEVAEEDDLSEEEGIIRNANGTITVLRAQIDIEGSNALEREREMGILLRNAENIEKSSTSEEEVSRETIEKIDEACETVKRYQSPPPLENPQRQNETAVHVHGGKALIFQRDQSFDEKLSEPDQKDKGKQVEKHDQKILGSGPTEDMTDHQLSSPYNKKRVNHYQKQ